MKAGRGEKSRYPSIGAGAAGNPQCGVLQKEKRCFLWDWAPQRLPMASAAGLPLPFLPAHLPSIWQKRPVASRRVANWLALLQEEFWGFFFTVWSKKTSLCGRRSLPNEPQCPAAQQLTCPSGSQPSIITSPTLQQTAAPFFLR